MSELRAWVVRDSVVITEGGKREIASQTIRSKRIGMLGWVDTLEEMGYVQASPWVGTNEEFAGKAAQYCRVVVSP